MIVFDLECVPDDRFPDPTPDDVRVPGNYSNPDSIARYRSDPANLAKIKRARSLNPLFARVVCFTYSVWEVSPVMLQPSEDFLEVHQVYNATDQKALMGEVGEIPGLFEDTLLALNGLNYDFPVMAWAALREEHYDLARNFHCPKRWGDRRHLDPITALPDRFTSMADLCLSLGIAHPSIGGGANVYDWFLAGEHRRIQSHGVDDVRATNMIALSMLRSGHLNPWR